MNKIFSWAFLLLLTLCSASCTRITEVTDPNNNYTPETTYQKLIGDYPFISITSRQVPNSVVELKNITYVRYGNRALQLDLYLPKKIQQKIPAIIFVHGGGWRAGYRTNFTSFAIAMAERGYAAATISYRLSPEAEYPAAIQDAKAAVRWLRQQATQYRINPDQIAIAGGSAGGQIASLAGVTDGISKFDPAIKPSQLQKSSSRVQAIINIDGLSDFTSPAALFHEDDPNKNPSAAGAWFGGRFNEKPDVWREASPLSYVNQNTPPILFLISNQERFSLGYTDMIKQMEPWNIPYQVVKIPNSPHSFWLFDPWLQPSVEAVVNFLNQQFNPKN
jgi:acetyl esterase/lipase